MQPPRSAEVPPSDAERSWKPDKNLVIVHGNEEDYTIAHNTRANRLSNYRQRRNESDSQSLSSVGASLCSKQLQLQQQNALTTDELTLDDRKILAELGQHYKLPMVIRKDKQEAGGEASESDGGKDRSQPLSNEDARDEGADNQKAALPRPENVTVLINSWYPPILNLSWNLNDLDSSAVGKLDFYGSMRKQAVGGSQLTASSNANSSANEFDLNLALWKASRVSEQSEHEERTRDGDRNNMTANGGGSNDSTVAISYAAELGEHQQEEGELLKRLEQRKLLLKKALTCFQITYNIINSR